MSMLDKAREKLAQRQPETSFDVLIDNLFEKYTTHRLDGALAYLKDWCQKDPDAFENNFRNINNFIVSKVMNQQKAVDAAKADERINYGQV